MDTLDVITEAPKTLKKPSLRACFPNIASTCSKGTTSIPTTPRSLGDNTSVLTGTWRLHECLILSQNMFMIEVMNIHMVPYKSTNTPLLLGMLDGIVCFKVPLIQDIDPHDKKKATILDQELRLCLVKPLSPYELLDNIDHMVFKVTFSTTMQLKHLTVAIIRSEDGNIYILPRKVSETGGCEVSMKYGDLDRLLGSETKEYTIHITGLVRLKHEVGV